MRVKVRPVSVKLNDMQRLRPYRIIKGSSDGTFISGEIIWTSKNGDINSVQAAGSIDPNEVDKAALDFEVEDAPDYEVIKINRSEVCRRTTGGIPGEVDTNS